MILPYANPFVNSDISGGGGGDDGGDGSSSGWQMIEPKENASKCITK